MAAAVARPARGLRRIFSLRAGYPGCRAPRGGLGAALRFFAHEWQLTLSMVRNTPSPFGPALSSLHPFPSHTGSSRIGSIYASIYVGVRSLRLHVLVGKGRRPRPVSPTGFRGVGGMVAWRAQWDASGTDFEP